MVEQFPSAQYVRYINDLNFRIWGFYTETEEDIQFFDIRTHTVYPIEELYEQIDARRLEPDFSPSKRALVPLIQVGGTGESDSFSDSNSDSSTFPIGRIAAAVVFVISLSLLLLKIRKARRAERR